MVLGLLLSLLWNLLRQRSIIEWLVCLEFRWHLERIFQVLIFILFARKQTWWNGYWWRRGCVWTKMDIKSHWLTDQTNPFSCLDSSSQLVCSFTIVLDTFNSTSCFLQLTTFVIFHVHSFPVLLAHDLIAELERRRVQQQPSVKPTLKTSNNLLPFHEIMTDEMTPYIFF